MRMHLDPANHLRERIDIVVVGPLPNEWTLSASGRPLYQIVSAVSVFVLQ